MSGLQAWYDALLTRHEVDTTDAMIFYGQRRTQSSCYHHHVIRHAINGPSSS